MEKLKAYIGQVTEFFGKISAKISHLILGENNERIDFFIDSFSKLGPRQKFFVSTGSIVGAIAVLVLVFLLYFWGVQSLRNTLANGFDSFHELKVMEIDLSKERGRFEKLKDRIGQRVRGLRVKPFIEELANKHNVTIGNIIERPEQIQSGDPLSKEFEKYKVELKISKVSLPRMLKFITDLEKSRKLITINEFEVRNQFGTRLYFNVSMSLTGYKAAGQG
jgi:hypothetical protein